MRSPVALLAAVVLAAIPASSAPAQGGRPNVLLITIDTLRADRVGAYGYKPARTPVLDRLAAEGVRFADATAHAPLTLPSHAAILTGRYPGAFGIRINGLGVLPESATTIAERFKDAGYRTGAVIASAVLDDAYGLAQGVDDYDDHISGGSGEVVNVADLQRPADQVTQAAREWIGRRSDSWFLWVHYYDPHLPYAAPPKYAASAPDRPYDAEVAFVDAQVGVLLGAVDPTRTIVVVTSDHGESLGDHGEPDHGFFLYDATLSVPLIVTAPSLPARLVTEQVRHIDLAPTIAGLAALEWPADPEGGENLVPLMKGGARRDVPVSLAESWYPRLHFGWSELRSARVGEWKYIAAPKPELYDLRVDGGETRNVVAERAAVAGRLAADLQRITARFDEPDAPRRQQPDPAAVERLQALGYLGAFAPVTAGSSQENPKDHITEYREYRELFNRALGLLGGKRPAEAAPLLQRLVKTNVRAFETHLYLGNAYAAMGRDEAALGEYDAAAQLNPLLATPHFEAAKVLSNRGDHDEAIRRCRAGLVLAERSNYGHYTLAVVFRKAERVKEAAAAFIRALELNPVDARSRAGLASAAMRLGDLELARAQFEEMVKLGYQVAPAQFNLGVIAARRGDPAAAARHYQLALAADPAFKPARDALARIKAR